MSVAAAVLRVRRQVSDLLEAIGAYAADQYRQFIHHNFPEVAMPPKLLTLALLLAAANVSAEPWTYSGTLSDGDKPANGRYDLRVTLLDATRSNPIGSPITFYSVQVHDGAFSVDVDFGSELSNAPPMLLKTEVSKDKATFVALGEPRRFDPKVALAGVCWDTAGNAGTNPNTNFIGTTDQQDLVLRSGNTEVARFTPSSPDGLRIGNVIFGNINFTRSGVQGASIGGGGGGFTDNIVSDDFGTIGGGQSNFAGDDSSVNQPATNATHATVSGGRRNQAGGKFSSVPGGNANCAGGDYSWAGGRRAKVRRNNLQFGSVPACGDADSANNATGDQGTFVWADSQDDNFTSSGPNQFLVRASGGVAINTATKPNGTSPIDAELTITSNTARPDTNVEIFMYPRLSTFGYLMGVQGTQQSNDNFFITQTDGNTFATKLQIDGNGTTFVQGGAVGNLSDARLKKNIGPIPRPLDQLLALQGHVYEYIDPAKAMNAPGQRMGFVAQEVQTVLPSWVKPTGNEGYLAVTPIGFEALAVEAVRDLKAENDVRMEALEKENSALRAGQTALVNENAAMRARLAAIEARLNH